MSQGGPSQLFCMTSFFQVLLEGIDGFVEHVGQQELERVLKTYSEATLEL